MKTWFMLTVATFSLAACTPTVVSKLPYYKMPVIQGTPLDKDAILSLQMGMTREQVELTLGKPLLRPSFRDNQWDYIYEIAKNGKVKEQHTLTIQFTNNVVSNISGSALAQAREQIQSHTK